MAADEGDIIKQAKELFERLNEFRKNLKPDSGDTDVDVKNVNFNVGKQNHDYKLDVEVDLSLAPKDKGKKTK